MKTMFPSTALRVVESDASKLVILDPPNYLLAGILLLVALAIGIFMLKSGAQVTVRMMAIILLPLVISGLGLLSSNTVVEFSKASGDVTILRRRFGFPKSPSVTPLSSLRYARVETSRGARRLALITNSGGALYPTGAAARGGEYEAANAINDFLGVRAQ